MMRTWLTRIQFVVVLFSAAAAVPSNGTAAQNAQAIYQQRCAPCHGSNGMGDGPAGVPPYTNGLKGRDNA